MRWEGSRRTTERHEATPEGRLAFEASRSNVAFEVEGRWSLDPTDQSALTTLTFTVAATS